MQAIILAAGMGRRLKELTEDNTKCMVRVNGKSLIERMLNQLDQLCLERIVMVVGYKKKELIDYIATLDIKTPVVYVDNSIYDKTNNIYSLYLARDYLMDSDTILLESDLIFDIGALYQLMNNPYPSLALVAKYESWMDGTVVKLENDNRIRRFISKNEFSYEDISSYYKTVNIYKFSKEFSNTHYVPFLEAYIKALGENKYYEQVLQVITMLEKPEIKAAVLDKSIPWYEIDDIQDLDIAESIFVDSERKLAKMNDRYGGYWRYPHMLDFCYLVNPYYPNSVMISELQANFENVLRMYPSGQRVNALLCAKFFNVNQKNIVVGNGAAELIKAIMEDTTKRLGVIRPGFDEYPNRHPDNLVEFYPNNDDYAYNADELMLFFDTHPIDVLCLVNPNNPSGTYIEKQEVLRLAAWAQNRNIWLLVDESFVDFAQCKQEQTLLESGILEAYHSMIIVKSISKSYGIPGLRLGIAASGNTEIISRLKRDVAIWNINSIAEFYMQISEKYLSEYKESLQLIKEARDKLKEGLDSIPYLRVIPSQANYFMCEVIGNKTAHDLCLVLLDKYNILIKDLSKKKGVRGEYVRIAVRDDVDNQILVNALKQIFAV